jgi:O-antigen ligase
MLVAEHPLFGLDPAAAHAQMAQWVKEGRLSDVALVPQHLHNDALQALVTGGVPGLLAWFGILAAPFVFFARAAKGALERGAPAHAPALAGMLVPLSYFGFGMTEMMFWSVRACMFYALMVFMLMGFCLNAKE